MGFSVKHQTRQDQTAPDAASDLNYAKQHGVVVLQGDRCHIFIDLSAHLSVHMYKG